VLETGDETLMAQVRGGDLRKLALLFERHHRALYNFFVHMTGSKDLSEDLVQEVFFRILRYRHTYDESRPFAAWLYQIARNVKLEGARKRNRELRVVKPARENEEAEHEPAAPELDAEKTVQKQQEIALLRRALQRLPDDKREVLVLSRFQNLPYEHIAQVLGCETGAVKVRVYRAVRELGQIYLDLAGEKVS
jgi:RNA polymerase sigma-70 factor (ECF subfamily)